MPVITIEQIILAEDTSVVNNLQSNGVTAMADPIMNKLLLLKVLAIYLPSEDKERLYSANFDELFVKYKGQLGQFFDLLVLPPETVSMHIWNDQMSFLYAVGSYNFMGTTDPSKLHYEYCKIDELYLGAGVAGIDVTQPPNVVQQALFDIMPSQEWQRNVLLSLPGVLSDEDRKLLSGYLSYNSTHINDYLRHSPTQEAYLNHVVEQLPALDKDIVVFRIINSPIKEIPDRGVFRSLGYLSTSIAYYKYADSFDKKQGRIQMLKIYVPKGKKAIYVPSHELEFIFPHNIDLEVINRSNKTFVSKKKNNIVIDLYELRML